MPRISISISEDDAEWLNNHPSISPSGLFKEALKMKQQKEYTEIKKDIIKEIKRRIRKLEPILRIEVLIHDNQPYFNFGPKYPRQDISSLMKWIREYYESTMEEEKKTKVEEEKKTKGFYLGNIRGTAYATVKLIREFDGENYPIVEFASQLDSS